MPEENIFKNLDISGLKREIPKKPSLKNLKKALLSSVSLQAKDLKKAAVLFSGGIDSSLVAKLVSAKSETVLFTVGVEGSSALKRAESSATLLHLNLRKKIISEAELKNEFKKVSKIIKTKNYLQLSIALPIYFAMEEIKQAGFKAVFCGQGADELFFGYDEFRRSLESGKDYVHLEDLRFKKLKNLWNDNLKRDFALAKHFGLELKSPYLEKEFLLQALAFSAKQNLISKKDFLRKRILRKLAISLKLPKQMANEKKKAVQYDSGISKILNKLA